MTTTDHDSYLTSHIDPEGDYLYRLYRATNIHTIHGRMASGHLQGRLLKMLVHMIRPKNILEVGTFSGYSAICMAEGLEEDGRLYTYEINDEMEDFIRGFIAEAPWGERIKLHLGDALELLPALVERYAFDLVYIDANKRQYLDYYELILPHLPSGAIILADNTLWDGKVVADPLPTDAQTQSILAFNRHVQEDPRVENLILPLRDGLSIIYKK